MKSKRNWWFFFFFILLLGLFFWPVFFKGWLPFPGDLLTGSYNPWSSYSFLGYAPGGVPHKAQGIDVVRQLFPWKHFSIEMLKKGEWPLWNPYNFAGNPHLANLQSSPFNPFNFVFFIFSFNFAWVIYILLQPFLAGFFTFLYLREIKINPWGAFLGGLSFAFGLYMTVWLEWGNLGHALLWLPFGLLMIEKFFKERKQKWLSFLVFSLVASLLAGYIQISFYVFGVIGLYYLFLTFFFAKPGEKALFLKNLGLVFIWALFLSLFQILPALEHFFHSARLAYSSERVPGLFLPLAHLITVLIPDFFGNPAHRNYWLEGTYIERVTYIGVIPLFFTVVAVVCRKKEKRVFFWMILAFLVLLLTVNSPVSRWLYLVKLPVFSTMVPTRLLGIFSFSLAILAGFGLDFLIGSFKKRKIPAAFFKILVSGGAVFALVWLLVYLGPRFFVSAWWPVNLPITMRNLILPTGLFFALAGLMIFLKIYLFAFGRKKKPIFAFLRFFSLSALFLLTIFDLYFYFQKITPFSPPEFVYPETEISQFLKKNSGIDRFWGYGSGYFETNLATQLGLYAPDGYDPLFSRRYGELIAASNDGQIKKVIPRSDVVLTPGFGNDDLRLNLYRQRLLNLLGVKYLLQKNENLGEKFQPDQLTFPEEIYQLIWQKGWWQVYENKKSLPRVFLAGDYQLERNKQKIADLIFDPDFPLEEKLILEEPLPPDFSLGKKAQGEVVLLNYQPNWLEVETKSLGNKLLFLSDNYYQGWRAEIDGQKAKIYRADYSFRALPVPKGKHRVVFQYSPDSFRIGAFLSLTSLIIIIGLFLKKRKFLI